MLVNAVLEINRIGPDFLKFINDVLRVRTRYKVLSVECRRSLIADLTSYAFEILEETEVSSFWFPINIHDGLVEQFGEQKTSSFNIQVYPALYRYVADKILYWLSSGDQYTHYSRFENKGKDVIVSPVEVSDCVMVGIMNRLNHLEL